MDEDDSPQKVCGQRPEASPEVGHGYMFVYHSTLQFGKLVSRIIAIATEDLTYEIIFTVLD